MGSISEKSKFSLLSVAHTVSGLCWIAPLLLPLIREELQLTYTQGGLLLTCYSISFSIFAMVSGHLGDIYDARKILSFGFLFTTGAYSLLIFTRSYSQILGTLFLAAVGVSFFYPVGMALVSRGWKRGIFFGLFEAAGSMGILTTTIVFSPLVLFVGWRITPFILTLPGLAMGLFFLTSRVNLNRVQKKEDAVSSSPNPSPGKKPLALFYVARGIQIFGGAAVMSFMPLFAVDVGGLSPERASLFPIFVWMGGAPGLIVYGLLSDIWPPLRIIFTLLLITIPTVFIITLSLPLFTLFPVLVLLGFCTIGAWVPQNMWLSRVTLEKARGKVYGGALCLVSLANISSPLFFGFVADQFGLINTYRLTIVPMGIAAVLLGKLLARGHS